MPAAGSQQAPFFENIMNVPIISGIIALGQTWLEGRNKKMAAKADAEATVIVKAAESTADWEKIQAYNAGTSWKDEWLTVYTTLIITACFIPKLQPFITTGFEILKSAPNEILWAILIVYSGSFGLNVLDKIKK